MKTRSSKHVSEHAPRSLAGLALLLCVFAAPPLPATADTAVSAWSGSGGSAWSSAGNWSGGVPSSSLGALFDAGFGTHPNLTANASAKGIWLKTGVGQDVTIGSTDARTLTLSAGATLNNLSGILGGGAGTAILLDDSASHNLTFGPGITLAPGDNTTIYLNHAGTLTIEGQLRNANGSGVAIGGTNALGVAHISGALDGPNGGSIRINTAGTVILSGASTSYAKGVILYAGGCRLMLTNALPRANVLLYGGTLQLRSDTDAAFSFGSLAMRDAYVGGVPAIIDVNRVDPTGGSASNRTLQLGPTAAGNNIDIRITGGNGYRLSLGPTVLGNNYLGSSPNLVPTTAGVTIESITTLPLNENGNRTAALDGTHGDCRVTGTIANADSGIYGLGVRKSSTSRWMLSGTNTYTGSTSIEGGTLVASQDQAFGSGGAARLNHTGNVTVKNGAVADLFGVAMNESISLEKGVLINGNPATAATLGDGVASVWFTARGTGFAAADAGQPLTLSGNGGAVAVIASLCANAGTFSASGGSGWATGNTITLTGGGAAEGARYTVTASGGAITALSLAYPGYGYTGVPTGYTTSGSGTGATVAYFNNFSVAAIRTTAAGNGYASEPTVSTAGLSGSGLAATAVISSLTLNHDDNRIGGDGDLTIAAVVRGANGRFAKTGNGVLVLAAANTYTGPTTVEDGTLSVVNSTGSGTGTGTVTVNAGATLAGSGILAPTGTGGTLINLAAHARLSPHVGTGQRTATLNANVASSSSPAAMSIAGGSVFDFALGAGGACDRLVVNGNLTLGAGTHELRIAKAPGFTAGTYTLVEVIGGTLTCNASRWTVPADPGFRYTVSQTANTITLSVVPAGTMLLVR